MKIENFVGKARTVLLLRKLKDEFSTNCNLGMCGCIYDMWLDDEISKEEELILEMYLSQHKPLFKKQPRKGFWWKKGLKAPRLKWLDKQINRLNKSIQRA